MKLRLVILPLLLLCFLRPLPLPQSSERLPQDAFIWQRQWTPGLSQSVRSLGPEFRRLVLLAAEIAPGQNGKKPEVVRVSPDWSALAESGAEIGLAIRCGLWRGPFGGDPVENCLIEESRRALALAAAAKVKVRELHLDFDCPDRKLAGYARWLQALRRELPPGIQLWITGLPSWLGESGLRPLLASCDGWVLQVHSLGRPESKGAAPQLCDVEQAKSWAEKAAELGCRFRVALPTFSWVARFDANGNCLKLSAEESGGEGEWVAPDAAALAGLVAEWTQQRPRTLESLIWFRLPCPEDRRNWRPATLLAVKAGRVPSPSPRLELLDRGGGLFDVVLRQEGEGDSLIREVQLPACGSGACDAPSGQVRRLDDGSLLWTAPPAGMLLRPGDSRTLFWYREGGLARPK
ncbi:MAG: hypothetical protein RL095_665 [Verrucomicrobiota bacterium]